MDVCRWRDWEPISHFICRLKFNGRAKKASKRNFQLVYREDDGDSHGKWLNSQFPPICNHMLNDAGRVHAIAVLTHSTCLSVFWENVEHSLFHRLCCSHLLDPSVCHCPYMFYEEATIRLSPLIDVKLFVLIIPVNSFIQWTKDHENLLDLRACCLFFFSFISTMSILNFARNEFFDDDDYALSAVAKSRLA